jgi:hypothetical protein
MMTVYYWLVLLALQYLLVGIRRLAVILSLLLLVSATYIPYM